MKTGPDALSTVENESGSAKHENGTRRTRHRRKRFRELKTRKWDPTPLAPPKTSSGAQNKKKGLVAPGTAEDESVSAKHGNGTQRPRYRQKRFRERNTLKWDMTPSVPSKNESGSAKQGKGTSHPRYCQKRVRERKT
jgi:hypothetical protein